MVDLTNAGFRELLGKQDIALFWLATGNITIVETCVRAKGDAIVLDLQHGLWERRLLEYAVAASGDCPLLVRVPENTASAIGHALDAGAEGVIVPMVETREQAEAAVRHAHYPPIGTRSGGGVRPLGAGFMDYVAASGRRTTVGIMIETRHGVAEIDSVISAPRVDYIFIGSGDLALSYGSEAIRSGEFEAGIRAVYAACRKAGIPVGIFTGNVDDAIRRRNEGFDLVVIGSDVETIDMAFNSARDTYHSNTSRNTPLPPIRYIR